MNETTPSLYQQADSKTPLRTGFDSGPSGNPPRHGMLVGGRVTGRGSLKFASGDTAPLPGSVDLPPGSVVLGRLDVSGDQTELRILSRRLEISNLGGEPLRSVLQRLNLPASDRALDVARRQLRKRGYLLPEGLRNAGGDTASLRRRVRDLLQHLDLGKHPRRIDRALQFLRSRPGADLESLWADLSGKNPPSGSTFSERVQGMLREIKAQLLPSFIRNPGSMDPAEIKDWLRQMGVRTDPATLDRARVLVDLEVPPTRRRIGLLESREALVQNEDGSMDRGRVRALLFLSRNDLPMESSLVRDLGEALSTPAEKTAAGLPRLDVSRGHLAEQLRQFVRGAGFDLERRVADDPARAARTLRAMVTGGARGGATADSVISGDVILAGVNRFLRRFQSGSGESGSRDAVAGRFLKHALASTGEQDRIYLFVPFEEGGEPKLVQLRYEDERDSESEEDPERWSVTLRLELSQLGPLQVEVKRRNRRLDLRFQAESQDAVRRIRAVRDRLRDSLSALGFNSTIQARRIENATEDLVLGDIGPLSDARPFRLDLRA